MEIHAHQRKHRRSFTCQAQATPQGKKHNKKWPEASFQAHARHRKRSSYGLTTCPGKTLDARSLGSFPGSVSMPDQPKQIRHVCLRRLQIVQFKAPSSDGGRLTALLLYRTCAGGPPQLSREPFQNSVPRIVSSGPASARPGALLGDHAGSFAPSTAPM